MGGGRDQDHHRDYPLAALIAQFTSGKWQAMVQTAGSYDPAAGVGVGFRFSSMSPFSGVHDPHLDSLLNQAAALVSLSQRCALYNQAADYIAQQFYGPFYFAFAPANVAVKGVDGPGLTQPLPAVVVTPTILWEDVANAADHDHGGSGGTQGPGRTPRGPHAPARPASGWRAGGCSRRSRCCGA